MAGMFGIRSEDIIPGAQGARPTQPAAPPPNPVQQQMMQLANARQLPQPPAPGPSAPFMQSRTGQELAGIGRAAAPALANVGMAVARPFQESVMGQVASRAYQDTQRAADAGRNMEALGASGRMLAAGAGAALEVPARGIGMALQEVGSAGREFWRGVTGAGQPAAAPQLQPQLQAASAPGPSPSPTAMPALEAADTGNGRIQILAQGQEVQHLVGVQHHGGWALAAARGVWRCLVGFAGVGAGEPCAGCADAVLVALVLLGVDLAAEAALGCAVGGAAAVLAPPVAVRRVRHRCPWQVRGDWTGDVTRPVLRIGRA